MNILLVEDNLGDVELLREALRNSSPAADLMVARDGLEAMEVLSEHEREGTRAPDLIVLDLNLPRMDGHELLEVIKSHPQRKHIPVVVMTSSSAPRDVQRVRELQANGYLVKPLNFSGFEQAVRGIVDIWKQIAEPRAD